MPAEVEQEQWNFGFLGGGSISLDSSGTRWHGTRVTALLNDILPSLGVPKFCLFVIIKMCGGLEKPEKIFSPCCTMYLNMSYLCPYTSGTSNLHKE